MRAERYSRAARNKVKPGRTSVAPIVQHHGDEYDDLEAEDGCLSVIPVREYVENVPQHFDEFNETRDESPINSVNQLGPCIEGAVPLVTTNDFDSYLAAFNKRSNAQPAKDDNCSPEFQRAALNLWENLGQRVQWDMFDVDDATVEEWLLTQPSSKRKRMSEALDMMFVHEGDAAYLAEKSLSVKVEVLLKRYDPSWAPRLIYAGNEAFNALTGPVAMIINKRLKQTFSEHRLGPVDFRMAYGSDDVQLATHLELNSNEFKHGAEGDFSANDLRQREFAADLFDSAIGVLGAPDWFRKLLLDQKLYTVYSQPFGHRAELAHQLATGTTITTPRNTIWNATIFASYCMATGNRGCALVLGDDLAAMVLKLIDCNHWSQWVADGSKMKLTGCTPKLNGEMTFLSRRICVDTEIPCMMPKLGKALARFNVRASKNQAVSDSAYMAGKALSYAYEFRHFPYFRDLFLRRYELEDDNGNISLSEVSWFSRKELYLDALTQQEMTNRLLESARSCKVLVSEDEEIELLLDAYGDFFDVVGARRLARRIITGQTVECLPNIDGLELDW